MEVLGVTPEIQALPSFRALRQGWPEFMLHDPVANRHWGRLYEKWPEFVLLEDGEVVAEGNAVPVAGPQSGWDAALEAGFSGGEHDRLCALAALVAADRQGQGLGQRVLEEMRGRARQFGRFVAPVRPSAKARYPVTPIERYIGWRRADGSLFDPWLRTHERLGARIDGVAPASMTIPGTVAEWERWAGMPLPETSTYVVPGALVPVEIDRENDRGLYVEPNVWMTHPLR